LFSDVNFSVFNFSFFEHKFVFSLILLFDKESLLFGLAPDPYAFVSANCDEKVANTASHEAPHFSKEIVKHENFIVGIAIKELDSFVLRAAHKIMRIFDKLHSCDAILVSKYALVYVTEVKTPQLDVFIRRARDQQAVVAADVKAEDGQVVPVQVEAQLHAVEVAHLHCLVEQRKNEVFAIVREFDAHYFVGRFNFLVELQLDFAGVLALS
jgi:hypothetical protein